MDLKEYPDAEMMMIDIANRIAGEIEQTLFHEDRASLAVPGGTTPGPIFDSLCAADLDWSRVSILLTDERCQVSVQVAGTPEVGILSGQRARYGEDKPLLLRHLSKDAKIENGM